MAQWNEESPAQQRREAGEQSERTCGGEAEVRVTCVLALEMEGGRGPRNVVGL